MEHEGPNPNTAPVPSVPVAPPAPEPMHVRVAPHGWYPTAEGSHERYWDGATWSAPRVRRRPVITAPDRFSPQVPEVHNGVVRDAYGDRPAYATVPPIQKRSEADLDPRRALPAPARDAPFIWVWLLSLTPILVTVVLLGSDAFPRLAPYASLWLIIFGVLVLFDTLTALSVSAEQYPALFPVRGTPTAPPGKR